MCGETYRWSWFLWEEGVRRDTSTCIPTIFHTSRDRTKTKIVKEKSIRFNNLSICWGRGIKFLGFFLRDIHSKGRWLSFPGFTAAGDQSGQIRCFTYSYDFQRPFFLCGQLMKRPFVKCNNITFESGMCSHFIFQGFLSQHGSKKVSCSFESFIFHYPASDTGLNHDKFCGLRYPSFLTWRWLNSPSLSTRTHWRLKG